VITTELLADIYETDVINIQVNHSRNKDRFVEGKHFFKLTGSILKEFKNRLTQSKSVKNRLSLSESVDNRLTNSQLVGKRARSLILWTERGAARHAKMLDTDQAWDVFEKLEDFYFNQKEAEPITVKTTTQDRTPLRGLVNTIMGKYGLNSKKLFQMVHHEFGVNHIDELTHDQLPSAIEYLATKAIEGEFLGREELPSPQPAKMDLSLELNNIGVIHSRLRKMIDIWEESISPELKLVNSPIASRFYTYLWDATGTTYSTMCAIERKAKKLLN
ncbi:ORF6N domain-containing protein, partial [Xenorhabdus bovienii]